MTYFGDGADSIDYHDFCMFMALSVSNLSIYGLPHYLIITCNSRGF
jgi:hypothetical protein